MSQSVSPLLVVPSLLLALSLGRAEEVTEEAAVVTPAEFVAPSWEELQKVRWVPQPCVDFLEHLRQTREGEPQLATEAEALAMKNDGDAANRKILQALGRLPESEAEVDWDAAFTRYIGGDPTSLNPIFKTSRHDTFVLTLITVRMIQPDWRLRHYGDLNLIESWEASPDQLMMKVVFRSDLTWTDGKPVTAEDVEFSWEVIMDARIECPSLRSIAGGLRAVKAYDDHTVIYFQKEALATNPIHPSWYLIPKHVYEPLRKKDPTLQTSPECVAANRNPVTCGPYRVVSWQPQQSMTLERREDWYQNSDGQRIRHKPFIKTVHFRVFPEHSSRLLAFQAGEIEDSLLGAKMWAEATTTDDFYKGRTKVRGDEWSYGFIGWNQQSIPPNPFFADRRVRLAMTHALDHRFLLEEVYLGVSPPGTGIFHPDSRWACPDLKPYEMDLDRAEELLSEAGWKDTDGDGVLDKTIDGKKIPFEFELDCPRAGSGAKVGENLQSSLRKIGVRCHVNLLDWGTFTKKVRAHKSQALIMGWSSGTDPDLNKNVFSTEAIKDGRNYVGYSNPKVDELFAKGRLEFDQEKRPKLYQQMDRLIYEDHPFTIVMYQPTLWGFSKSIRGYRHSPRGFYGHMPGFFSMWKKKSEE
jgi:peptide/nickel transport system substrate-binding protein